MSAILARAHPSWQEETGVTNHARPRAGDATPPLRWDWQIRHPFLPPMFVGAECRDPRPIASRRSDLGYRHSALADWWSMVSS